MFQLLFVLSLVLHVFGGLNIVDYPIPATWAALKTAMRTRWVPPYYQRELLQKLPRLRQAKKFCRRILSGITNWHD